MCWCTLRVVSDGDLILIQHTTAYQFTVTETELDDSFSAFYRSVLIVTWPLNESETGVDLILIETSLHFM